MSSEKDTLSAHQRPAGWPEANKSRFSDFSEKYLALQGETSGPYGSGSDSHLGFCKAKGGSYEGNGGLRKCPGPDFPENVRNRFPVPPGVFPCLPWGRRGAQGGPRGPKGAQGVPWGPWPRAQEVPRTWHLRLSSPAARDSNLACVGSAGRGRRLFEPPVPDPGRTSALCESHRGTVW